MSDGNAAENKASDAEKAILDRLERLQRNPGQISGENTQTAKRNKQWLSPFRNVSADRKVELLFAAFLTAATIVNVLIAARQWGVGARQADLMDTQTKIAGNVAVISGKQAEIADKQLSLSTALDRPWIAILQAAPSGDWRIVDGKAMISLQFWLKNDWQLPAIGVWVDGEMYSRGDDASGIVPRGKAFCEALKHRASNGLGEGFTSFPGGQDVRLLVLTMTADDVNFIRNPPNRRFAVMISGCIDYITTITGVHHQTPFVYELDKIGTRPTMPLAFDPNVDVILAGQLGLFVHPLLTWNAD